MAIVTAIRRLLRRFLLWLAAVLDEAPAPQPQSAAPGGPPADWLARVRRGAPQLLEPERGRLARQPPGVSPGGTSLPRLETSRGLRAGRPRSVTQPPALAKPWRTRAVIEEELVARRGVADGPLSVVRCPSSVAPALSAPTTDNRQRTTDNATDRWPKLRPLPVPPAQPMPTTDNGQPTTDNPPLDPWPELPPSPLEAVESLDDADRLRRITAEQRGSAWSE